MASAYPFTTTWTGAGDGTSWSDAANWSNGVPLTGANAPDATQDIATIDNSVETGPFTLTIDGTFGAGTIDVDLVDPVGGDAVSLTGTLSLSTNVTSGGSGFGVLDLVSGTFAIDGGTLGGGEIKQDGGTLAFGSYAKWGDDTLAGAIVDGATAIDNASFVIIQRSDFAVFDGLGGYGTAADVTISDGSTLSAQGDIYLDGLIDVQATGTLSLDGGNLNGWGQTGTLYADGGTIAVTQNVSVNADFTFEGGLTFTGPETLTVAIGGDLTLESAPAAGPMVVNLDGGTIDVSGGLNLENTVLENGTLILEAGATYSIDSTSSVAGLTVTDNRPAAQTNWTGAAGDDDWSNAANWTNGVPQSGLGFDTDGQSVAVINNIIDPTPSTIVISGQVNAQDIYLNTADPQSGPSVSLTGTLDTSYSGEGGAYGYLDLTDGTFEIDGGTLSYTGVGLNGGNLRFGPESSAYETFNTDIINGNWSLYDSGLYLEGTNVFHGQGGGGETTVTLNGGAQMLVTSGTLDLDGTIDIQDGSDSTLLALDGGNLSGYGGDTATILLDDGIFAIDANTTFSNAVAIYGAGLMVFGDSDSGFTLTIDSSSVTTIGQAGGALTTVNLNGGTLDVFGTLNLTNTYIENGTIIVEAGGVFNQDSTDQLVGVAVVGGLSTATNWTGGGDGSSWSDPANWDNGVPLAGGPYATLGQNVTTIDNTHGDSAPFTVDITGNQAGALVIVNATDPTGGVAVSLQGSLNLALDANEYGATLGVLDLTGGTFEVDGGTLDALNVNQLGGNITFGSDATWGAATLNAAGIAGGFTLGNGSDLVIAQNSFGSFNETDGYTVDDVTIDDDSTLDIKGSFSSANNIHIVSGTVILDGGTLSMNNGAKLTSEGGALTVQGYSSFDNGEYDGAVTIGAGNTLAIGSGDSVLISNPGGQYAIALNEGTVDVYGTLNVAGAISGAGNVYLENGSTLSGATVDDATVNVYGSATLDNVTIDAPLTLIPSQVTGDIVGFSAAVVSNGPSKGLTIAGVTTFGNAADTTPMQVNLNGGVLYVAGTLNLVNTDITDGTIIVEGGGVLNSDAVSQLDNVTLEQTLPDGSLAISGENVVINSLLAVTTAQAVTLKTGVTVGGAATGTAGQVTFDDSQVSAGVTGAGVVTVSDPNGLSDTIFNGATISATVAGQALDFVTDIYDPNYGTFSAANGGSLVVGYAANESANLTSGVFNGSISATNGSSVLFYGAEGISVVNGQITLDGTSSIAVATGAGNVALAQSITSIGSQNPTTYLDQDGILNLNDGANFIDPNAVTLYGTINLAGGTLSTGGLSGNDVVFNSGFGTYFPSGVLGYGTIEGGFGSTTGSLYMEASGGTLTYTGALNGFVNLIADANSELVVNSAIDTAGYTNGYTADLGNGSTVDLAGTFGDLTNFYANFTGSNATLILNDPTGEQFRDINIQANVTNDVIDLAGLTAASLSGGAPDVTITRTSATTVTVTINPAGDPGAYDTFTLNNVGNEKVTFNPSDGNGGSQIVLTGLPVITTPGYVTLTQGYTAAVTGVSLTDLGIDGNANVTATLTDSTGLLGATGTGVSGAGTTTLTVTGTLDQVNAALATLTDTNAVLGPDVITLAAVDSAGDTAPTQTLDAYVEAPIVISAATQQYVSRNVNTPLTYAFVYEQGALSGADLTVTVSDTTGILAATGAGVTGSGTTTLTLSGSQDAINADLATITVNEANQGTDTVVIAAQDGNGDKAQNVNIALATYPPPTSTAPGSQTVTQNSITSIPGFTVSEPTSPYGDFTVQLSDSTGLLNAAGSTVTGLGATSITLQGSLAQLNAELATLTIDETGVGSDTLNMTVTDAIGGTSTQSVAITSAHVAAPDLTVSNIVAPTAATEGQTVQLTWTVTNSGDATATGPWSDNVYLASDATGTNQTLVGSFTYTGTLAPGQSETETQTVTVPTGFSVSSQTGTATTYFIVQADANNQTGALSGIQNHVTVSSTPTAATQTIDWKGVLDSIMPQGIDATDYALFEQRFIAEVGTTDASYSAAIANAIATLDTAPGAAATYSDAVGLLIQNAGGGLGDQQLAQVVDPSTNATGLNALLAPSYYSDLTSRNNSGVFGDGWSSELNDVGALGPMNGLDPNSLNPGGQAYVVTIITTYVDQYGDYLGQSTTYQVVAPASYGINFLDPTNPYSNYTQTNANGTIETFSGISGLLVGISDGQGNAIAINRNSAGVITSITTVSGHPPVFTVNAQGNITSATDSSGNTITYTYDATGTHLLSSTSSLGTTSYQYSTSTNPFIQNALTQVTDPDGGTQAYTYDAQGNIATQSVNGAAATTFGYTGTNTITRTNAAGETTTYTLDASGQTTAITDASGNTFNIQYNVNGDISQISTATGQSYHYTYDASGNITDVVNPLGASVQQTFAAGTSLLTSITDQNGNLTQYQYNTTGQVSDVVQADGTGTRYQYNSAGLVSEKIEASGATIQYSYNAAGQITSELFSDGTSQSYAYNAAGDLTSSTAVDGGVTTYGYNAQGLLASVTNAAGQVESYSYNAAGQETQRVEPDGSITNYTYTTTGQLAQITDGSGAILASYSYNSAGALSGKTTGNGASTVYTYDAAGNMTEIKTLASDGSTTSKLDYTYDANSRIATATSSDGTWTYTYDAANQLTHAVFASTNAAIASQNLTYEYDAAGNRTQTIFNGATTNYTTNNLNQYTSADGTTFSYDANGNLVSKVSTGSTTTYTYNVQNQLLSSTDATGTTTYTYDALGNIASQTVNGVKTTYVSDPLAIDSSATGPLSAIAQAYNASGQATATYTYGNGLTAVTSSGTTSYYNSDASGNITSLSGVNGALTETYSYTPSGTLLNSTGSMANPFQFNGLDGAITQANGLVNTRARYYDPATGRFISQDPTGQSGGTNLYTYAANNSINFVDANGDSISPSGVIVAGAGIILSVLGGVLAFATAPVTAVVVGTAGVIIGGRSYYQAFNHPGGPTDIYVDTPQEQFSNVAGLVLTPIPGGRTLAAAQLTFSAASTTDLYDPTKAYQYATGQTIHDTDTVDVPEGDGNGDVHLTTFDGVHFNFQAVGEFVLAQSTAVGDNFQVQIRLSALGGPESGPTYTTEIGIQVGNDRVTFGAGRTAVVWINGVASSLSTSANTLTLAGGTISQLSQNTYQVTEKTGEIVDITDNGQYFNFTVDLAPSAKPGSVEGLLGTFTGAANAFQLPNGTVLGATLTSDQLYQTFGNAWRISDATSLLDYAPGETTATYTDLAHPDYSVPITSLPTAVVQAATDAAAAAGLTGAAATDAVYDYLSTGDPTFITNAAASGSKAPVTSTATITPPAAPPPSIGVTPSQPSVTEVSGQTPVTFTVSLSSVATTNTVIDYVVSATATDPAKTYFGASDFGGTLPSGTLTILAGQTTGTFTVDVPDAALGSVTDKWLAVGISTPGADPIYNATAQVDVINNTPVAGAPAQPLLEYEPGNAVGASQYAPTLTHSGSSYVLNLGDVVQGTTLAAMQFALANMASAPADTLVSMELGAVGTGFNASGLQSATMINAGNAVTALTVQPLTSNLGAQSTAVTLGALDTNSTGYSANLGNITLTVTENVIAAAQALLGTTAIVLGDARVGSADTQTISVTNSAAAGAASLDVTVGAATGAVATGSISQLAAGASDSTSLSLGVDTATAGKQSSFVTLNLASDLGNGIQTPLALNQSVSVTGSVYRSAAATVTQSATVVHVGDAGSQDLLIANSDPADGYSEGLRATATGSTAALSVNGTTGLIAAGTTDASSISVGYSTATAGVVSGTVDLGLTSDGTGIDSLTPIALGTDAVQFNVAVDNYATADLKETAGGGTLTGSAATGYSLDLGTILQGSGSDTIDLAALNSASGLADLLSGTFGITGDAAFTNTGFGAFSGLSAGQSDGGLSVSLSTANDGTFSETITLTGTGSNASGYSGAVAPVTLTIHGQVATETPVAAGGVLTGAITELPGLTGSTIADTAQGTIAFTDSNLSATHTASVLGVAATGDIAGLPSSSVLQSLLTLGTVSEDTAPSPGQVAWNFAAADDTFDYLGAGETLTLTYVVAIAEVGGGSATQDVTITVTGTNDLPIIAGGTTASASITAIVASSTTPPNDTASGTIRFSDADADDTHTATVASVSATGAVAGLPGNSALLALLATTAVTEPAGTTTGAVGWNFTAPDATFAYLQPGQIVTLTYAVDVSDNHGGTVTQDVTVNVTGAPGTTRTTTTSGTFLGASYAAIVSSYTAAGFRYQETFENASGQTVASVTFTPNGGFSASVGGVLAEVKTVNADGSYDVRYYSPTTILGSSYAGYDIAYDTTGFSHLDTFYNASGAVAATVSFQTNGSYTYTVGGALSQVKTVNADKSYDVRYYTATTILGSSYAGYDIAYDPTGVRNLETLYNASGVVAATVSFQTNGSYTYTVGGALSQVKTVNADKSYDVRYYTATTILGSSYAGYDIAYDTTGFSHLDTFYSTSGAVAATVSFQTNGSYTYTVGGALSQVKTVNPDGTYEIRSYAGITILGAAYAGYGDTYSASGVLELATLYNSSGSAAATLAYTPNGGYTYSIGGALSQVKTVNADHSYDIRYYSSTTVLGTTYAGYDNAYDTSGFRTLETLYDAQGNVVATASHTPDGGYVYTVGGVVTQTKAVNADGSYTVDSPQVQGQVYTAQDLAYNAAGSQIAIADILTSGANATILKGTGLTFDLVGGVESVSNTADTFQLGADAHGALSITGAANATLAFGTGDGAQVITGFATSGGGADALSFSTSVFADYAHLMGATKQQGSDLLITLDASDTLLLKNVSMSSFTSANVHFT